MEFKVGKSKATPDASGLLAVRNAVMSIEDRRRVDCVPATQEDHFEYLLPDLHPPSGIRGVPIFGVPKEDALLRLDLEHLSNFNLDHLRGYVDWFLSSNRQTEAPRKWSLVVRTESVCSGLPVSTICRLSPVKKRNPGWISLSKEPGKGLSSEGEEGQLAKKLLGLEMLEKIDTAGGKVPTIQFETIQATAKCWEQIVSQLERVESAEIGFSGLKTPESEFIFPFLKQQGDRPWLVSIVGQATEEYKAWWQGETPAKPPGYLPCVDLTIVGEDGMVGTIYIHFADSDEPNSLVVEMITADDEVDLAGWASENLPNLDFEFATVDRR